MQKNSSFTGSAPQQETVKYTNLTQRCCVAVCVVSSAGTWRHNIGRFKTSIKLPWEPNKLHVWRQCYDISLTAPISFNLSLSHTCARVHTHTALCTFFDCSSALHTCFNCSWYLFSSSSFLCLALSTAIATSSLCWRLLSRQISSSSTALGPDAWPCYACNTHLEQEIIKKRILYNSRVQS